MERRGRFPGMHVYHYAPYERTALSHLMGQYGTRQDELDELLRSGALVDLYRVMRQALAASPPRYSIKNVEELYGFERTAEVAGGSESVVIFERWLELGTPAPSRGDPRLQRGGLPLAVPAPPLAAPAATART
jgi:predicted RecB family nuclease